MKADYFNCALTKTNKHIRSKRLLAMAREERAEISILFFSKQHFHCCRFEPLMYFTFLDNTLSVGVFTLIKLLFETQAAKL